MHLENQIKRKNWFPRIWLRYVDDIFAIIKKKQLDLILSNLNDLFPSIKFTYETEVDGCIPFLDFLIRRNLIGDLEYTIYRKPTSNQQFIPVDSNHSRSHKLASFNSMFHRLFSVPMKKEDFDTERSFIFETGKINGYKNETLSKLFKNHKRKLDMENLTTLIPVQEEAKKFISLPFYPRITFKLENELSKHGYKVAYNNNGKISDILGNTKDKEMEQLEKSGIYMINCDSCDKKYIGQTKRKVNTRIKEHRDDCFKPPNEEKPMPYHMIETGHSFGEIKLLKEVKKSHQLNSYESIYLDRYSNENLANIKLK